MTDDLHILSIEDRERWNAEHERGGLPSQAWRYAWALSAAGIDPKLAVVRSGGARMLLPFFEREWFGTTDIATIQGLSGASISPSSTAPLRVWRDYAVQRGWVAGYIQLATTVTLSEGLSGDELVASQTVFLLDLRAADPLASVSNIVRRKIRRAAKVGAVLVDDPSVVAENLKLLYPATMRRVGARPLYAVSPATLERWVFDPSSIALGARVGRSVEAVSLFCVAGTHAEYHINASTLSGRDLSAWLIWSAIERLRAAGVEVLNLGGAGARPGDGVAQFKERFHGESRSLWALRQIYDDAKYDELCRRAGVTHGRDWFPAYRAQSREDLDDRAHSSTYEPAQ
jgi:hypothetical protein